MTDTDNPTIGMENQLHVRLLGVEYPQDVTQNRAIVTFAIISDGHDKADNAGIQYHARLRIAVALNGNGRNDYQQIVTTAASKLAASLKRMATSVNDVFMAESSKQASKLGI